MTGLPELPARLRELFSKSDDYDAVMISTVVDCLVEAGWHSPDDCPCPLVLRELGLKETEIAMEKLGWRSPAWIAQTKERLISMMTSHYLAGCSAWGKKEERMFQELVYEVFGKENK